ncbi:DUF3631 domain-containing protein [Streptomyces abikoensis]|uniref:DUF3631 domain-containing protein n=1 Tax=Streptomyces abikoensis TaxID=97398 RepID=UPI0033E6998D
MTILRADLTVDLPCGDEHRPTAADPSTWEMRERAVRAVDDELVRALVRALRNAVTRRDGECTRHRNKAIELLEQMMDCAEELKDFLSVDARQEAARQGISQLAPAVCPQGSGHTAADRDADPEILRACREVFAAYGDPAALSTAALLSSCHPGMRPRRAVPGPDDEFTARDLSDQLAPFGIRPGNVTVGGGVRRKGYRYVDFVEAWLRYSPGLPVGAARSGCDA